MKLSIHKHSYGRSKLGAQDGINAGLLAALSIAVWFFGLHFFLGNNPLTAPAALGTLLFYGTDTLANTGVIFNPMTILGYTFVHVLACIGFGSFAVFLARRVSNLPFLGAAAIIGLACAEALFLAFTQGLANAYDWPILSIEVLVANLIAFGSVAGYIWFRADHLRSTFRRGLWNHATENPKNLPWYTEQSPTS